MPVSINGYLLLGWWDLEIHFRSHLYAITLYSHENSYEKTLLYFHYNGGLSPLTVSTSRGELEVLMHATLRHCSVSSISEIIPDGKNISNEF